jgi:hypothetical protein
MQQFLVTTIIDIAKNVPQKMCVQLEDYRVITAKYGKNLGLACLNNQQV